jgi:hypothetical protein
VFYFDDGDTGVGANRDAIDFVAIYTNTAVAGDPQGVGNGKIRYQLIDTTASTPP